ncbi:hypothetical protein PR048_007788 [Dryococelus australis]|uniref:Uncharacterized protein n=1 Tax=Dryococelus australis TaxID=614101 RepID=A0ABQ9HV88_9NEOP|nr:hypothetical protein PR048_007788 [Dryococelus australis]
MGKVVVSAVQDQTLALIRRAGMGGGEAGDTRECPPTNDIVRHDSHMRESGVARPGIEPGSPWWDASGLTAQPPWPLGPFVSFITVRSDLRAWPSPFTSKTEGRKQNDCLLCQRNTVDDRGARACGVMLLANCHDKSAFGTHVRRLEAYYRSRARLERGVCGSRHAGIHVCRILSSDRCTLAAGREQPVSYTAPHNTSPSVGRDRSRVVCGDDCSVPIRVIEVNVKQRRNERAGGTGDTGENPADLRQRPARIPLNRPGIESGSLWWEAGKVTAQPPRLLLRIEIVSLPTAGDYVSLSYSQHYLCSDTLEAALSGTNAPTLTNCVARRNALCLGERRALVERGGGGVVEITTGMLRPPPVPTAKTASTDSEYPPAGRRDVGRRRQASRGGAVRTCKSPARAAGTLSQESVRAHLCRRRRPRLDSKPTYISRTPVPSLITSRSSDIAKRHGND